VRLEGLGQMKKSTSSGLEHETSQLAASAPINYDTACSPNKKRNMENSFKMAGVSAEIRTTYVQNTNQLTQVRFFT
jgi:hypothetical protein